MSSLEQFRNVDDREITASLPAHPTEFSGMSEWSEEKKRDFASKYEGISNGSERAKFNDLVEATDFVKYVVAQKLAPFSAPTIEDPNDSAKKIPNPDYMAFHNIAHTEFVMQNCTDIFNALNDVSLTLRETGGKAFLLGIDSALLRKMTPEVLNAKLEAKKFYLTCLALTHDVVQRVKQPSVFSGARISQRTRARTNNELDSAQFLFDVLDKMDLDNVPVLNKLSSVLQVNMDADKITQDVKITIPEVKQSDTDEYVYPLKSEAEITQYDAVYGGDPRYAELRQHLMSAPYPRIEQYFFSKDSSPESKILAISDLKKASAHESPRVLFDAGNNEFIELYSAIFDLVQQAGSINGLEGSQKVTVCNSILTWLRGQPGFAAHQGVVWAEIKKLLPNDSTMQGFAPENFMNNAYAAYERSKKVEEVVGGAKITEDDPHLTAKVAFLLSEIGYEVEIKKPHVMPSETLSTIA
jgi:hypothetical protein